MNPTNRMADGNAQRLPGSQYTSPMPFIPAELLSSGKKVVRQCTQSQEGALQDDQANADPPEPHLKTKALTTSTRM